MKNVLLLREPSSETPDKYESVFSASGYHPLSIPVLETVHDNVEKFLNILLNGPSMEGFAGVIITSKRSCDTLKEALSLIEQRGLRGIGGWCDIPFYVVGQATATAVSEVFDEFKKLGLQTTDIRGQSSGTAAALAPFILEDMKGKTKGKLLFLTGDKNRDTMTRILTEGGIGVEPLQVYKTRGSPAFLDNLSEVLQSLSTGNLGWWIIYFAPSAAGFATPILRNYFSLNESSAMPGQLPVPKIASIGPTTYAYLTEELKLHVDVVAQKPTPEAVVNAIITDDRETISV